MLYICNHKYRYVRGYSSRVNRGVYTTYLPTYLPTYLKRIDCCVYTYIHIDAESIHLFIYIYIYIYLLLGVILFPPKTSELPNLRPPQLPEPYSLCMYVGMPYSVKVRHDVTTHSTYQSPFVFLFFFSFLFANSNA